MKLVPLTQGHFAMVDDEDFEWICKWKWCALKRKNTIYAVRIGKLSDPIPRRMVFMHKELIHPPLGFVTDHVDMDGLNNQKENLRSCSRSKNMGGATARKNTTSKYRGVHKCRRIKNPWFAQITINGSAKFIGRFSSEKEAKAAYDKEAALHYGKFYRSEPCL